MRSGTSVLGVLAGALLGLGVVLAGSGIGPYSGLAASFNASPDQATHLSTSVQYVTTTNASGVWYVPARGVTNGSTLTNGQGGENYNFAVNAANIPVSQLGNIARQPITLTGFALLPIFAALLFGFVLYWVPRARKATEEPSEPS